MLTFELAETDKHSIKILLRRKNLRFLRRTNLIKTRCHSLRNKLKKQKQPSENRQITKNILWNNFFHYRWNNYYNCF